MIETTYYLSQERAEGTKIMLFKKSFILMISKSMREQANNIIKEYKNTSKVYQMYRETQFKQ